MPGGVEYGLHTGMTPVLASPRRLQCGEGAGKERGSEENRCSVSLVLVTRLPLECSPVSAIALACSCY